MKVEAICVGGSGWRWVLTWSMQLTIMGDGMNGKLMIMELVINQMRAVCNVYD